VTRTAVVLVEAASLEHDPDAAEHFLQIAATVGALGEGVVLEGLNDLEVLPT